MWLSKIRESESEREERERKREREIVCDGYGGRVLDGFFGIWLY